MQPRADRVLTLDIQLPTFNFHCFGALGVWPGTLTLTCVLAWHMGSHYSYCRELELLIF